MLSLTAAVATFGLMAFAAVADAGTANAPTSTTPGVKVADQRPDQAGRRAPAANPKRPELVDNHRAGDKAGTSGTKRKAAPARPTATATKFGAAVHTKRGQTYRQALNLAVSRYGKLGVVRKYYPGLPAPWSRVSRDIGSLTPVVSFKANPKAVNSGKYDEYLRKWFASAPTDRIVYWVYFHEPENDIARHAFTAAQYRAAWARVHRLAASAHQSNLKATLTLMCYTLWKGSHRDWRDYYAGKKYVDVLAWDCYNKGIQHNGYADPAKMFDRAIQVTRAAGLPVAFAEIGSKVARGDGGARRAAWLTQVARYLYRNHAVFVSYFDSIVGGEFRLLDRASIAAWHAVVSDQRP